MKKNFVTFYSPGTFVAENTTKPIDSWDVESAKSMASGIKERHGAVPYAFRFSTRERGEDDLDSSVTEQSPLYYLGGEVETLEEVKARSTSRDSILISNMEGNGWARIITGKQGWSQPLGDDDVVLEDVAE